jgi:hypothetical protein
VGVGDTFGGGAGSHTRGKQQLADVVPPAATASASKTRCTSCGNLFQGTIATSCGVNFPNAPLPKELPVHPNPIPADAASTPGKADY